MPRGRVAPAGGGVGVASDNPAPGVPAGPCPLCAQTHSEPVSFLFESEGARVPGPELVDLRDYLRLMRAQARAGGNGDTEWGLALLHRLRAVEGQLVRRRKLRRFGAPPVPRRGRM